MTEYATHSPLSSERQIQNLLARYAELVDGGDFAGLGALLETCEFALNDRPPVRGADAIARLANAALFVYDDGTPRTKHVTSNIHLEVDQNTGTAAARSYYTVLQATPGFPLQPVAVGHYEDQFERHDGRWHFARRQVTTDLVGDTSHHARPAA